MADKVHCVKKTLRLMPAEAEILAKNAKSMGLSEAEYLRLLISQEPNDYPQIRALLKELVSEVNAIGNNINQITRNYNSKLYRLEDREKLNAYMKKLNMLTSDFVSEIRNWK